MNTELADGPVETLTLRFVGEEVNGTEMHELRAAHVAEVLQGLVALSGDFAKAGAFGDWPAGSDLLVRPAQQGSFLIEVLRVLVEDPTIVPTIAAAAGVPTLSQVIWWATRSARAEVSGFTYLENGNVKVDWQDNTSQEIPVQAWQELQRHSRRRKKQLRQIMTPLRDVRVSAVEVRSPQAVDLESGEASKMFALTEDDFEAVQPDAEEKRESDTFEVEAQMSAIDFDDPTKWRVRTKERSRAATVEDEEFLARISNGLAVRKSDIFRLKVLEDVLQKNGRISRTWTVLKVESYRKAHGDSNA